MTKLFPFIVPGMLLTNVEYALPALGMVLPAMTPGRCLTQQVLTARFEALFNG